MVKMYERLFTQDHMLLLADLLTASHQMFDQVAGTLGELCGADCNISTRGSGSVLVDLGVGTEVIYRLSINISETDGTKIRRMNIWRVNKDGNPISDTFSYLSSQVVGGINKTSIIGSSLGSMESADLRVSPVDYATRIYTAFCGLGENNWKVIAPSGY